jgi:hypothetical protein
VNNWGVNINVTQADIDGGIRQASHFCPVALAVKRELKLAAVGVSSVGPVTFYRQRSKGFAIRSGTAFLPPEAIQWVARYDGYQPVEPFSFVLELMT